MHISPQQSSMLAILYSNSLVHCPVQAGVELCWLTCVSSELNAEELTRCGGITILGRLLQRCFAVIPADVASHLPAAIIVTQCLRAFAGMSSFANARRELLDRYEILLSQVSLLIDFKQSSRNQVAKWQLFGFASTQVLPT